jgi:hypothetical protein
MSDTVPSVPRWRRHAIGLLALVIVFGPPLWLVIAYLVLTRQGQTNDTICRAHLTQLGHAFKAYAATHGGRLPDAATWTDELQPYLGPHGATALRCPADRTPGRSSYAMNRALSGKTLSAIPAAQKVLLYETKHSGANPNGDGSDAVDIGRENYGRHFGHGQRYNFYLYSDFTVRRDLTNPLAPDAGTPKPPPINLNPAGD